MDTRRNKKRRRMGGAFAVAATALTLTQPGPAAAETADQIYSRFFGSVEVNGVPATGTRHLAVGLLEFSDKPMPQNRAYYDNLVFGVGDVSDGLNAPPDAKGGSVSWLLRETSYGRMSWNRAGLYGPYRHADDPRTTADESRSACVVEDPAGCAGVGLVTLGTFNGKNLLQAAGGGGEGSVVNARPQAAGAHERFTLVDRNGGTLRHGDPINLVAFSGHYLSAEGGGGREIVANRTWASDTWERFVIIKKDRSVTDAISSGDQIALRVNNGQYVSAIGGGGGEVVADRAAAREWESFRLTEVPHDSERFLRYTMKQSVEQGGLDFSRYDSNGDGTVQRNEMVFVKIGSGTEGTAQFQGSLRVDLPGSIPAEPAVISAAGLPGLDALTHELLHSLGLDHYYGSNANSQRLTPMSVSQMGAYARDAYHLDPWSKFLLGWVRPVFVRLDLPINGCRTIAPADNENWWYAHSANISSTAPILMYNPNRPNEYYMVEYRKRAGADRDVATEGLVMWMIKTKDDGSLVEVPGQVINPGPDGVLDSQVAAGSDDQLARGGFDNSWRIWPGADRKLDSVVVGDDGRSPDPVNIAIGSGFKWGGGSAWTASDRIFQPRWLDGSSTAVRIQAGPLASALAVEMAVNGSFVPSVSGLSSASGAPGTTVDITGQTLGVQGRKRVVMENSAGTRYFPQILSWTGCTSARVQLPSSIPTGDYRVYIEGDGPSPTRSAGRAFTVS